MTNKKQPNGWAVQLPAATDKPKQNAQTPARPEPAQPKKPPGVLAKGAAIIGGLFAVGVAMQIWQGTASGKAQQLRMLSANESISSAAMDTADADLARLLKTGLPRIVTIRDWAAVDGDGVEANGVKLVAGATPTPITFSPGSLALVPFSGTTGCITLEIADPAQPPYRLCLAPGQPTPEITVH